MKTTSKKGFALIVVLAFVVLVSAVLVAFMMSVMTERSSSSGYAASISARRLGDIAVALVQTQINSAATSATNGVTWVSQPGMVRTLQASGTVPQLVNAFKLYSAPKMIDNTFSSVAADNPGSGGRGSVAWDKKTALWVDLNAPIISAGQTNYPILDPSCMKDIDNTISGALPGRPDKVLGLSGSGIKISQVPVASGTAPNPAPMPVQWLYVLADGKVVAPTAGPSQTSAGVSDETADNPIVGRIAFWTDDETCKVNINTASAGITTGSAVVNGGNNAVPPQSRYASGTISVGAYWDIPRTFTQTEAEGFALRQPARGEYQRYPGHPATVSLATLFPVDFTALDPIQYAELLYKITPRVVGELDNPLKSTGAWTSMGGTQLTGSLTLADIQAVPLTKGIKSDGDRLFNSVDEMIFSGTDVVVTATGTFRRENKILNKAIINSRRFFLTAHSRAPEVNLFGLPRIATWPITSSTTTGDVLSTGTFETNRTNIYDRTIGLCSSTGSEGVSSGTSRFLPYFFQRQNALDSDNDYVNISRNKDLYAYLQYLTGGVSSSVTKIPGWGGDFLSKYGDDRDCILTQIVDYIRCLNLYDDTLNDTYQFTNALYGKKMSVDSEAGKMGTTGTSGPGSPGHSFVASLHINTNGKDTSGQGRCLTLKQLGIVFIACAVGDVTSNTNDTYHDNRLKLDARVTSSPFAMIDGTGAILWPSTTTTSTNITFPDSSSTTTTVTSSINYAPYSNDPKSNMLLKGQKLQQGEVLVQAAIVPEFFSTMSGWRMVVPNMRVEIDGLQNLRLGGTPLKFPPVSGTDQGWATVTAPLGGYGAPSYGGDFTYQLALTYRMTPRAWAMSSPGTFPVKSGWLFTNTATTSGTTGINMLDDYSKVCNKASGVGNSTMEYYNNFRAIYPWISDLVRVPNAYSFSGTSTFGSMTLTSSGPVTVRIKGGSLTPSTGGQEFTINFPVSTTLPVPKLPLDFHINNTNDPNATPPQPPNGPNAVNYWTFFNDLNGVGGTINNTTTSSTTSAGGTTTIITKVTTTGSNWEGGTFGRFSSTGAWSPKGTSMPFLLGKSSPLTGQSVGGMDVVCSMIPNYAYNQCDYRIITAQYKSTNNFIPHPDFSGNGGTKYVAVMSNGGNAKGWVPNCSPGLKVMTGSCAPNGDLFTRPAPAAYPGDMYGDFDIAMGGATEGALANKPDEGDFTRSGPTTGAQWSDRLSFPYYTSRAASTSAGPMYFSPNRMMASPVQFGSLPACVASGTPWRTLLFRAQPDHPGAAAPRDHLLLDLFWMPVVEPYAISDRFSTAGKINMNYQILPFTYINRDAAMRAVLAPEQMQLISNTTADIDMHPLLWSNADPGLVSGSGWNTTHFAAENHFPINVNDTLLGFDKRFQVLSGTNVFISASEICDLYMYPATNLSGIAPAPYDIVTGLPETWWKKYYSQTGDNVRERIYATIYPKLTTKSNTYTVHYRVQSLKKAPTGTLKVWKEGVDAITGEYRGSTTIERFIDPNKVIPDYANHIANSNFNAPTLDAYYKWRVIQNTQFAP